MREGTTNITWDQDLSHIIMAKRINQKLRTPSIYHDVIMGDYNAFHLLSLVTKL